MMLDVRNYTCSKMTFIAILAQGRFAKILSRPSQPNFGLWFLLGSRGAGDLHRLSVVSVPPGVIIGQPCGWTGIGRKHAYATAASVVKVSSSRPGGVPGDATRRWSARWRSRVPVMPHLPIGPGLGALEAYL